MMLMNINSKKPMEKDAKAQADMGKTNAGEPNVTIVTSKRPRLPDPIIGKYNEDGLFGAKPGFVKGKGGKEVTIRDAILEEENEAASQARLEKEEADRKKAKIQEKQDSKMQELIDSREKAVADSKLGTKQLAKGLAVSIAITSAATAGTLYLLTKDVPSAVKGLAIGVDIMGGAISVILSIFLLIGYVMIKTESARVRVLRSIQEGKPVIEKDLKRAITFDSGQTKVSSDSVESTKSDFVSDLIELERFPAAVEAIKLAERTLHMKFGYFKGSEKEDDADE